MDFPRTVEEIYDEYTKRRGALFRALTDDVEDFYSQCDPDRDNLCLYALRDGTWRVDLPAVEVPPETPEPTLGINFARDGMQKRDWLALVAVHSDAWLLAVAFFYGVKLDAQGRLRLFKLINSEQTLFEVVSQRNKGRSAQLPQHLVQQNTGAAGAGAGTKKRKDLPSNTAGRPTEAPFPSGRLLKAEDINPNLRGRAAELFWPDNKLWYLVEIQSVNVKTRSAKITYATGEEEDLELEEILRDGHMALL